MIKLIKELFTRQKLISDFKKVGGADIEWFISLPTHQMKEVVSMINDGWDIGIVKYLCNINGGLA